MSWAACMADSRSLPKSLSTTFSVRTCQRPSDLKALATLWRLANVLAISKRDRVAYAGCAGAYCEDRLVPADRLVKIPDGISYETAAAMLLQGMTVCATCCAKRMRSGLRP